MTAEEYITISVVNSGENLRHRDMIGIRSKAGELNITNIGQTPILSS